MRRNIFKILIVSFWLASGTGKASEAKKALNAYRSGDYEQALRFFEQETRRNPDSAWAYLGLGSSLYRLGRFEESRKAFEEALRRKSTAEGWYDLGNAFFRSERFQDAVESYRRALEIDPNDQDARYNLELALRKLQENRKQDQSKGLPEDLTKPPPSPRFPQSGQGQKNENKKNESTAETRQGGGEQLQTMSQKDMQELFSRIEQMEKEGQQAFSRDPKREHRRRDAFDFLPREQAEFLRRFFGEAPAREKQVEEDW